MVASADGNGCGMNLRGSEVAETEYALPAVDYFPDHPVVQEMVEKAVRYLEKETTFTDLGYRERSFSRRSRSESTGGSKQSGGSSRFGGGQSRGSEHHEPAVPRVFDL